MIELIPRKERFHVAAQEAKPSSQKEVLVVLLKD